MVLEKDGNRIGRIKAQLLLVSLLTASFVFSYFPVWKRLLLSWHHNEDYSHGFFIVPISIYILWQKREALKTIPTISTLWGLVLMVFSLLMYYVGQIGEIITLSSISMVLVLFGVTLYLRGPRFFKVVAFPLCFLFFMIPVPSQIYRNLTIPLQLIVSKISVAFRRLPESPFFEKAT